LTIRRRRAAFLRFTHRDEAALEIDRDLLIEQPSSLSRSLQVS